MAGTSNVSNPIVAGVAAGVVMSVVDASSTEVAASTGKVAGACSMLAEDGESVAALRETM